VLSLGEAMKENIEIYTGRKIINKQIHEPRQLEPSQRRTRTGAGRMEEWKNT